MRANHQNQPSQTLVVAAFAAIYIIWGSTYLGILFAIKTIPPFLMAGVRFLIAGGLLLGWCLLIKKEKLPAKGAARNLAFSGLLMLFMGNGAVTWVEQFLPSSLAAIVVATVPLWFVLLDKKEWNFYFSNKWIVIGLLVGFAGVVFLFSGKAAVSIFNDRTKLFSLAVLVVGTVGWTVGSLFTKYKQSEGSTLMKVGIQMLAAGSAFLLCGLLMKEGEKLIISRVSGESVAALLYLIFIGSLIGYIAYMWLLEVRPPSLVGTYAYVNPVVAVFLGWAFAGEAISGRQLIGLGIIITGLLLVNLYKDKKQKSPEPSLDITAPSVPTKVRKATGAAPPD